MLELKNVSYSVGDKDILKNLMFPLDSNFQLMLLGGLNKQCLKQFLNNLMH